MGISLGSRLSFEGGLCTVRYIGEVKGTKGQWLGVEWDDSTRGKHSGEHDGVKYFQCKSKHPTAGSFVRPTRQADRNLSFLQAANEKYVSELEPVSSGHEDLLSSKPIEISGKIVEEVGFEKIRRLLAELQELRIVLLDGMRVYGVLAGEGSREEYENELKIIARTCPKIVELDLSRNVLRRWTDVAAICEQLKLLKILKLNGNRFDEIGENITLDGIAELALDETLMEWKEVAAVSKQFPSLRSLSVSGNEFTSLPCPISSTIQELILEYNGFESIHSIRQLASLSELKKLSLRGNMISRIGSDNPPTIPEKSNIVFSSTLTSLDISFNKISHWSFIDMLPRVFPGLATLRVSDNPLYDQPPAPSRVTNMPEYPMTVDEAYMLTLARLPRLETLNYSKITDQDRNNGELYYLSLIRKELAASPQSEENHILELHPRYRELCSTYGEVEINRETESSGSGIHPRSLAARLVTFNFYLPDRQNQKPISQKPDMTASAEYSTNIPKSFDVYRIKALVARHFSLSPLRFKLVWETDEWDPIEESWADDDEWDSSDEIDEPGPQHGSSALKHEDGKKLIRREEELVNSTREVGFWFTNETRQVRVRIESF
ncbi:tubulin-specific chaperone E [Histoplasma capsulatum G186AR]|uniref:Tubulin-specific chaperone E n=2 Tax=Ajellomyces capsulatus TaxID=5037 RepID=C0NJN6_AJECG|nr:tubulin-specific chaperone E [Histoplasma capsulatum G186AR]EEH08077.1 tubulin-specific chaperone E [Histoplasma capsulatum G186AR]KAG5299597.1 tubulin-specific chaperone E [Histoplasma capsulatum]QSS67777.1 tubulin-specific chaperone E [Histoplasma capsulatum G186AR]